MNKKGFTLMELLAVIIILGVVSTIAAPIVINLISTSKENANRNSVTFYGRAIDNAVKNYMASNNGIVPKGTFKSEGKKIVSDEYTLDIDFKGNDISCDVINIYIDGEIYLSECKIGDSEDYIYEEGSKTKHFTYGNKQTPISNINVIYDESCKTNESCKPTIDILPEDASNKRLSFSLSKLYGKNGSYTNSIFGALSINENTGEITKLSSFINNSCYFVDVYVKTTDGSNITKSIKVQLTGSGAHAAECDKW